MQFVLERIKNVSNALK